MENQHTISREKITTLYNSKIVPEAVKPVWSWPFWTQEQKKPIVHFNFPEHPAKIPLTF